MGTRRTTRLSVIYVGLVSLLLLSTRSAAATDAHDSKSLSTNENLAKPDSNVALCAYTVTTVTGKRSGAETDSVISLRMENKAAQSVYFSELDNGKDNGKRQFQRGHTDKFDMLGACVTDLCKMTLYTDSSWDLGAWFVETVGYNVVTRKGSEHRTWDVHQWLPRDDDTAELYLVVDDCNNPDA